MNIRSWKSHLAAGALLLGAAGAAAATFTVNSTSDLPDADPGDGLCATCDGQCTLRAAIMQANYTGGTNTIILPPGVYLLTRPGDDDNAIRGDLDIIRPLIIQGAGPDVTIIDGNGAVTADRVFQILSGATTTSLSGLTIRNGNKVANVFDEGGGLLWEGGGGHLHLTNVVFESNVAHYGGGLYLTYSELGDTVDMDHVIVRANTATTAAAGGLGVAFGYGAGFQMANSQVYSNSAYEGGGISLQAPPASYSVSSVRIEATEIYSNVASLSAGLENGAGDTNIPVIVLNSRLHDNNAGFYGGAIGNYGALVIAGTTLNANGAGARGGGVYSQGGSWLALVSSTLSGNHVTNGSGGGIFSDVNLANHGGTLNITNCTIANNSAPGGNGGGITNVVPGTVILQNTLIANNTALTTTSGPDFAGHFSSEGFNLIRTTNGMTLGGSFSTCVFNADPLLGPLQNNGGLTSTHALLPGSPALDKGFSGGLTTDQRGFPRPYDTLLPNAAFGDGTDIGAVEMNPGTLLVVNRNDHGAGSLRQALLDNAALGGNNTIAFSDSVTNTITLTNGELAVTTPVIIAGPGAGALAVSGNHNGRVFDILGGPVTISGLTIRDGLVIGAAGASGQAGFDGQGGGLLNQATLALSNCVVLSNSVVGGTGGPGTSSAGASGGRGLGGGICNAAGSLILEQCSFTGNSSVGGAGGTATIFGAGFGGNGLGGAICILDGTNLIADCTLQNGLAKGGQGGVASGGGSPGIGGQGHGGGLYSESVVGFLNSTVSSNSSTAGAGGGGPGGGVGGGIYNLSDLGLTNCTIANNSAVGSSTDSGGGIHNDGTLTVFSSTIAGNQADFGGGLEGFVTIGNTLLAGNSAGFGPEGSGTITSSDYNLIQNPAGLNFSGATNHNITGQNPLLGPLQNNGGPTFTMALLSGSPAIDKGKSLGAATDQRGLPRPYDQPSIANAAGGDGSDIGAFEVLPVPGLNIQPAAGNNVVLSWSADAANFRLESASNLPAANTWSNVNNTRVTVSNKIYVTNPATGDARFYRLEFP
jgi:CSLREA domain-containing protein